MTLAADDVTSNDPRLGVVTLFGYGIQVRVDRGHLLLDDGIVADRRQYRFPRVGHNLRRLTVAALASADPVFARARRPTRQQSGGTRSEESDSSPKELTFL
jgi:hypothetical protein